MASKSKRRRKVLGASCILAALIIAGSSFAWFTSKDEVTNRLSASANYGVAIAEDFQPPADWLPGQKVNKDVAVVNTGNVDAFVRTWFGGQMRLLNETTGGDMVEASKPATGSLTDSFTAVTDADKLALGLTWETTAGTSGATPTYYKTLSTQQRKNPDLNGTSNDEETNNPATFSEVQSVQAGGVLVMAPANAGYHWTLEQATTMSENGTTVTDLAKGTIVGTNASTYTAGTGETFKKITSSTNNNYYGAIDASTFKPETEGLYIFRRTVAETADGTANTYEYSGYYYVPAVAGTNPVPEQYFALHYDTEANAKSDYVLPSDVINDNSTAVPSNDQVLPVTIATGEKIYLYTAKEQVIETGTAAADLQWTYNSTAGSEGFAVKYVGADGTSGSTAGDTDDDIVINITLANIGSTSETWKAIGTGASTTFYYNNDVEGGDTTTKLVDSLELSEDTKNKAYLAFDFDLDVFMESQQVTVDDTGKEHTTPVNTWAASTGNTGAKPNGGSDDAATYANSEISVVGWGAL